MTNLSKMLNICMTMPNMGAFVFYLIFIFLVPLFMFVIKQDNLLGIYLPLLVPLAIILQNSGKNDSFSNLYPKENSGNIVGITSKIIINLIAFTAIIWNAITMATQNNRVYGVVTGLTSIIIIFILSPQLIPLTIDEGDKFMKKKGVRTDYNWHKYTFGIALLIAFVILEVICVMAYDKLLVAN